MENLSTNKVQTILGQVSLPQNLHIEHSSMAPSPLRLGIAYGKLEHQQTTNYFYMLAVTAPSMISKMRRSSICLLHASLLENFGHRS